MTSMGRRRLALREHEVTASVPLSLHEVEGLRTCPARLRVHATGKPGVYDVQAAQVVGALRTARMDVVIHPKVPVEGFLHLLGHAPDLVRLKGEVVLDDWDELLDGMTTLYAVALSSALRGGLLRGYQTARDALPVVRGRVDAMSIATRRFGILPPVDCEYEEFTPDIEVNRRLLAAAVFLLRSGAGGKRTQALLRAAIGQFDGVEHVRYRPPLAPLGPDRRLFLYGPAIDLAHLVLSTSSIELRHGDVASMGFLVNMDDLYEAFVSEALRSALGARRGQWTRHPPGLYLDRDRWVKLEPDIVWRPNGPPLPIDAKYKRGGVASNPDVYQMAAYCAALGVARGVLVCAGIPEHTLRLRNGVSVEVMQLDPGGSPTEVKARVQSVATALRAITQVPEARVRAS